MKKNKWISPIMAVVAIALIVGLGGFLVVGAWSGQKAGVVVENGNITINQAGDSFAEASLGATPGTDHYNAERFAAGFAKNVQTTSTAGSAATMTEAELAEFEVFEMMVTSQNFAWTLPATSSMSSVIPNPGDSKQWIIRSMATTTGATKPTLTITKGTGWNLMGIDANVDVILPNETAVLDCFRAAASSTNYGSLEIVCGIQELIVAD